MGLMDVLLGRTKPVPPNLDQLFALPSAAITLQAATDFLPTGVGSVCFRAVEGKAFSDIEKDVTELLAMGDNKVEGLPPERPRSRSATTRSASRGWSARTTLATSRASSLTCTR